MGDNVEKRSNKYVTFKSGNEYFGIDIQYVNEIIVYQEITQIPECEDYIKGLINLRGKIIPVIDVRLRFKQEAFEYNDRTCIIVVKVKSTTVGLIVEKIAEVVEIVPSNIIPSPSLAKIETPQNRYVYAIGKVGDNVKLLLDPDRLLNDDFISSLDRITDEEENLAEIVEENRREEEASQEENKEELDGEQEINNKEADSDEVKEEPVVFIENPMFIPGKTEFEEAKADNE